MWTEETIAGHHADIYEPPGSPPPRFGVLFLHPYGLETPRERPAWTSLFEKYRLVCVAPQGGRCWWADRLCSDFDPRTTPEQFLLHDVLPTFRARWGIGPRAVGLLGISMGGQGALRLAFKQPRLFPVAAGIASALDYHERYGAGTPLDEMYDSKEQARQDTALLHIHPSEHPPHLFFCIDPEDIDWYRGNDRLHEKLTALGVPHTYDLTTQAGGHSWAYFDHMAEPAIRFVAEALEKESRRLL